MRKKLSLLLYLLLVEAVACALVIVPAYAFQVSSSSTGYVRVATSAAMSAYQAATLPTQAASIAGALAGSSAGSSFVGLGLLAGLTLWEVYYNAQHADAIKAAAAGADPITIAGYTGPILAVVSDGTIEYVAYGDGRISNGCPASAANSLMAQGFTFNQSIELSPPLRAGPYCAMGKLKAGGGAASGAGSGESSYRHLDSELSPGPAGERSQFHSTEHGGRGGTSHPDCGDSRGEFPRHVD